MNKEILNEIKNEIYSLHIEKTDEDFIKLIKLNNIDKELFEVLILIHSNYKAEMQNVKTSQTRVLSKMIDYLITNSGNNSNNVKAETGQNLNLTNVFTYLNPKVIFLITIGVTVVMSLLWGMFIIDPAAAEWVIQVISKFVH